MLPQTGGTLSTQRQEEAQSSPGGGGAEDGGVCIRAADRVSVRTHDSLPAETAAVVLRPHHVVLGWSGSVWYGAVGQRQGQHHGHAALHVLRFVSDAPSRFYTDPLFVHRYKSDML